MTLTEMAFQTNTKSNKHNDRNSINKMVTSQEITFVSELSDIVTADFFNTTCLQCERSYDVRNNANQCPHCSYVPAVQQPSLGFRIAKRIAQIYDAGLSMHDTYLVEGGIKSGVVDGLLYTFGMGGYATAKNHSFSMCPVDNKRRCMGVFSAWFLEDTMYFLLFGGVIGIFGVAFGKCFVLNALGYHIGRVTNRRTGANSQKLLENNT